MPRSSIIVLLGTLLAAVGCNSRPHAPALLNDPIYQDDLAGFRLEIPDSWIIYAKSNLTRGEPLPEERKLVGYRLSRAEKPAMFEISCMDLPDGADLTAYFTRHGAGSSPWHREGTPESITLGTMPAQRLVFVTGSGTKAERKEVVAVRIGGRTYFFTLVSAPTDAETREAVRRRLAGMTWKPD
jgi:hypothetical protein